MNEAQRREYLQAMGIQYWVPRSVAAENNPVESEAEPSLAAPPVPSAPTAMDDASATAPPVAAPVSRPESGTGVASPSPAPDEPPAWLDEVPPPADEYHPTVDPAGSAGQFDSDGLLDDRVSQLDWPGLAARVAQCEACELHKSRTRTVFGVGAQTADLMIIGEAPGVDEDRKGEPFVGRAGQLLNAMLKAIGLGREQVYIANILKCRPPGNRDPRAEEALKCAPYLQRQVELVNPKVILAVGAVAARNLLQRDDAVGRLRTGQHHYRDIPLVVTYHPAYLLRSPEQKAKAWQDLQKAVRLLR
ncbi:uracil-DNA glycosylase [Sedimenticola thiotaurini]|uniref:Type-4 uracil-DNA glycosylase n=1 Tax=Sedimenticola thiotaurini TaxID=1543721 RepID=A0A0F7K058_9GAMM|nr:uracil-DNA glycosylase [Sedimenticola thiotaurini]AKH20298.1 hypothetical protein AAY24_07970 [Sedimenticola thiotaurini]